MQSNLETLNELGDKLQKIWKDVTATERPKESPWPMELERAHREWQAAENYFQAVTEPELVDHAVFQLQACERKYAYILGTKRREHPSPSPSSGDAGF